MSFHFTIIDSKFVIFYFIFLQNLDFGVSKQTSRERRIGPTLGYSAVCRTGSKVRCPLRLDEDLRAFRDILDPHRLLTKRVPDSLYRLSALGGGGVMFKCLKRPPQAPPSSQSP